MWKPPTISHVSLYANVAHCTGRTTESRKTIKTILLIAALGGLAAGAHAQTIVVAGVCIETHIANVDEEEYL
jgi:hypothetical protein